MNTMITAHNRHHIPRMVHSFSNVNKFASLLSHVHVLHMYTCTTTYYYMYMYY